MNTLKGMSKKYSSPFWNYLFMSLVKRHGKYLFLPTVFPPLTLTIDLRKFIYRSSSSHETNSYKSNFCLIILRICFSRPRRTGFCLRLDKTTQNCHRLSSGLPTLLTWNQGTMDKSLVLLRDARRVPLVLLLGKVWKVFCFFSFSPGLLFLTFQQL